MHREFEMEHCMCKWGEKSEPCDHSIMALGADSNNRILRFEERGQQLLPGIPNHITLGVITPKLSWRADHILSSLNRCWQEAIQSNEVHDARARANSTETLIVHYHIQHDVASKCLALYSTNEKRCYELPPIPWLTLPLRGLQTCEVFALRSKLYVLRVRFLHETDPRPTSFAALDRAISEVYVLDLSGPRKWKQCASMLQARFRFGCGVVDGKIYVFGGMTMIANLPLEPLLEAEVYDPQENKWSSIMRMPRGRFGYQIATIGKELLLYDGSSWLDKYRDDPHQSWSIESKDSVRLEIYSPAKNKWRLVELFGNTTSPPLTPVTLFVAKEKLYLFSHAGIDVYDFVRKSWTNRHVNSFHTDGHLLSFLFSPIDVNVLKNNELVVIGWGHCLRHGETYHHWIHQSFHCKDFDTEKKELVWKQSNCSHIKNPYEVDSTVVTIQL